MQADIKKRGGGILLSCVLLCLLLLAVTQVEGMMHGVADAISLCARSIIPSLFPFLVLCELLLARRETKWLLSLLVRPLLRPLRLSAEGGTALLLGVLFGFPLGARVTAQYFRRGEIGREEAERLLLFSGNASPFFLIGSVGIGMLSSFAAGLFLYLLQISLSLATGFLLARFAPRPSAQGKHGHPSAPEERLSLSATVKGAVHPSLYIAGYVLLFSAAAAVLLPFFEGTALVRPIISLLEIGNACAYAARVGDALSLPFCAFSVSFSGLSVFFQTLDVTDGTSLSLRRYLPVKLTLGAVAFFLAMLFPAFR